MMIDKKNYSHRKYANKENNYLYLNYKIDHFIRMFPSFSIIYFSL